MARTISTMSATQERKVGARALANRTVRRERETRLAAIVFKPAPNVEYTTNKFGSRVRVTAPTPWEVEHFFRGRRAFDIYEVLEELGTGYASQFVRDGLAVETTVLGPTRQYIITQKAASRFHLPATLPNGCPGAYAKAA